MLAEPIIDRHPDTTTNATTPAFVPAPEVTIVVPTRHEIPNVDRTVARVGAVMHRAGFAFELLFVDDSDDRTPEAIARHASRDEPTVRLIHRRPGTRAGGLAGALCAGLTHAHGRYAVCIDADLQHPPELLAPMARLLRDGVADVVIGTRYAPGGDAEGLGGPWRRLVSAASRDLTRLALPPLRHVTDPGSGLFGLDRRILSGVTLEPSGFKTLVEVLARSNWTSVCEVPYRFGAREHGRSNASVREGLRFLRHLGGLAIDPEVRARPVGSGTGSVFGVPNVAAGAGDGSRTIVLRHTAA